MIYPEFFSDSHDIFHGTLSDLSNCFLKLSYFRTGACKFEANALWLNMQLFHILLFSCIKSAQILLRPLIFDVQITGCVQHPIGIAQKFPAQSN